MIGLIGRKVGMTQVFDETGVLTPVTVIRIEPNVVVGERTEEKNGYQAVVLGAFDLKKNRVRKPVAGQFPEGIPVKRYLTEMKDFGQECKVGDAFGVELFEEYSFVDISGKSKGKGFQGVIKRHNFGGGRKTHGSKFHRANGSTGQSSYPSKVLRGTKMAGRMGYDSTTVQNLEC